MLVYFLNRDVFCETCETNKQTKKQEIGLNLKNARPPCFQQPKPGKTKTGSSEARLHLCLFFWQTPYQRVSRGCFRLLQSVTSPLVTIKSHALQVNSNIEGLMTLGSRVKYMLLPTTHYTS